MIDARENSKCILEGKNAFMCGFCNKIVREATQTTKLTSVPTTLLVTIVRSDDYQRKIFASTDIPEELKVKDKLYTLQGVIVHHGANLASGHYYTFAKTATGTWMKFDDATVSPLSSISD
jgi:ubiquitin C-terminal hydrolase